MVTMNKMKINGKEVDDAEFNFSTEDGMYQDSFGNMIYRVNGLGHREDGPALILANGQVEYLRYGMRDRDPKDGPAIVYPNGKGDYWQQGYRLTEFCQRLLNGRYTRWIYFWLFANSPKRLNKPTSGGSNVS